jgi:hypothetical protein
MRKVLAIMLMLFCSSLSLPLVSANFDSVPFKHTSAYSASYVALIILVIMIADFAIFVVRRRRLTKQSLLYLSAFSCWVSYFAITIYGGLYSIMIALGPKITAFGYITLAIGYITMAVTLVAIGYSGIYLIRRRGKLASRQEPF